MNDPDKLVKVIKNSAPALKERMPWAEPLAVLGALAEVESAFGAMARPRHERIYDYGGVYWSKEKAHKYNWYKWGSLACCSYSSFQIMYPTAVELGFDSDRNPWELQDDENAIPWVLEYIQKRILDRGARTLNQFADAYNSGNYKDLNVPEQYIQKFQIAYGGVIIRRNLDKEG